MILKRLSTGFSEVLATWSGDTVVLIGGGPSVTADQIEAVRIAQITRNVRCVAINDSYLLAPWANVHYAADAHWHRWHTAGIPFPALGLSADQVANRWENFYGQKCTIRSNSEPMHLNPLFHDVHILKNAGEFGLSSDPQSLITGRNSGFQALNLAILAGAKKIILIGFDGKVGNDGKTHWFGDHPKPTPSAAYPLYVKAMSVAESEITALDVEVINCSPGSWIETWPKKSLGDAL